MANEFIDVNSIINDINEKIVDTFNGTISADDDLQPILVGICTLLKTARQHLSFLDHLRGGTPTALDAVDTENIDVGTIITVNVNGRYYQYELVSDPEGAIAELPPYIIKPDVYHNKYWKRTDVLYGEFTNDDLAENILVITHNARTLYVQVWIYDDSDEIVHGKQWYKGDDPEMETKVDLAGAIAGTYKYILRW